MGRGKYYSWWRQTGEHVEAAIYREGIETGNATFAPQPPATWKEWCKNKIAACSLVAKENQKILGWVALSPTSTRAVYAGVVDVSIYVSANARGKGVGSLSFLWTEREIPAGI